VHDSWGQKRYSVVKDLEEILKKFREAGEGTVIEIDGHIPKVTIRVHDSRTMTSFGISYKEELGFTLGIQIDKRSKKGKKIISELKGNNLLTGFNECEEASSFYYVKDFDQAIDKVVKTLKELLAALKQHRLKEEVELHYTWPIKRFIIQNK
jgi:hypothetical protein